MSTLAPGSRLLTAATAVASAPFTAVPAVWRRVGAAGLGCFLVVRVAEARAAAFLRGVPVLVVRAVFRAVVRSAFLADLRFGAAARAVFFLDTRLATLSPLLHGG